MPNAGKREYDTLMTRGVESVDQNHTCEYRFIASSVQSARRENLVRFSIVAVEDWNIISLADTRTRWARKFTAPLLVSFPCQRT
jgi:hypothetical protein